MKRRDFLKTVSAVAAATGLGSKNALAHQCRYVYHPLLRPETLFVFPQSVNTFLHTDHSISTDIQSELSQLINSIPRASRAVGVHFIRWNEISWGSGLYAVRYIPTVHDTVNNDVWSVLDANCFEPHILTFGHTGPGARNSHIIDTDYYMFYNSAAAVSPKLYPITISRAAVFTPPFNGLNPPTNTVWDTTWQGRFKGYVQRQFQLYGAHRRGEPVHEWDFIPQYSPFSPYWKKDFENNLIDNLVNYQKAFYEGAKLASSQNLVGNSAFFCPELLKVDMPGLDLHPDVINYYMAMEGAPSAEAVRVIARGYKSIVYPKLQAIAPYFDYVKIHWQAASLRYGQWSIPAWQEITKDTVSFLKNTLPETQGKYLIMQIANNFGTGINEAAKAASFVNALADIPDYLSPDEWDLYSMRDMTFDPAIPGGEDGHINTVTTLFTEPRPITDPGSRTALFNAFASLWPGQPF